MTDSVELQVDGRCWNALLVTSSLGAFLRLRDKTLADLHHWACRFINSRIIIEALVGWRSDELGQR